VNARVALLLIGLAVGGIIGWLTRPEAVEFEVGPVRIEIEGDRAAGASGNSLTSGQATHVAIIAVLGGLLGLGLGFVVDRRA